MIKNFCLLLLLFISKKFDFDNLADKILDKMIANQQLAFESCGSLFTFIADQELVFHCNWVKFG